MVRIPGFFKVIALVTLNAENNRSIHPPWN